MPGGGRGWGPHQRGEGFLGPRCDREYMGEQGNNVGLGRAPFRILGLGRAPFWVLEFRKDELPVRLGCGLGRKLFRLVVMESLGALRSASTPSSSLMSPPAAAATAAGGSSVPPSNSCSSALASALPCSSSQHAEGAARSTDVGWRRTSASASGSAGCLRLGCVCVCRGLVGHEVCVCAWGGGAVALWGMHVVGG